MPEHHTIDDTIATSQRTSPHGIGEEVGSEMAIASVTVLAGGKAMSIAFESGSRVELAAAALWRACPSAAGRRRRLDGRNIAPAGVRLTSINPVGRYAVNLAFSDGHDRGIYPWRYLLDLALRPTVDDFITPG